MNNKIIGFTISKNKIDHSDIDIFGANLQRLIITQPDYYLYLWGIGNIQKCFLNKNTVSLSFPLQKSLKDRNIIIRIRKKEISVENDWLGSIPVFYNPKRKIVSTIINKTLPQDAKNIDPEGLYNYLEFGYCVFGKTPFRDTKFLRYYSKITLSKNRIIITSKKDYFLDFRSGTTNTDRIIKAISRYIDQKASMIDGKIIIPTSGGYDSRLLNFLVRDRKRIDSFTYGITNFSDLPSCEVAKAQRLSQLLGTSWKEIKLGNFHKYCREWFRLFGCSTHLHGMYQVEFYKKVAGEIKTKASLLSGIFGDVWNGKVEMEPINKHGDLPTLGYSHNISLRGDSARFKTDHAARLKYFSEHKDQLNTAYLNPILTVRLKLILISYLMSIPDYFGIPSWTPFLNYKIVKSILSLNEAGRKKRSWQTKFYQKSGVWLESMGIKCTDLNTLNLEGNLSFPISPLDQETLKTLIKKKCLKRVQANYTLLNKYPNRDISKLPWPFNRAYKNKMDPYSHMLILKSLELTLKFLETKHY